jgi:hypothetical protein
MKQHNRLIFCLLLLSVTVDKAMSMAPLHPAFVHRGIFVRGGMLLANKSTADPQAYTELSAWPMYQGMFNFGVGIKERVEIGGLIIPALIINTLQLDVKARILRIHLTNQAYQVGLSGFCGGMKTWCPIVIGTKKNTGYAGLSLGAQRNIGNIFSVELFLSPSGSYDYFRHDYDGESALFQYSYTVYSLVFAGGLCGTLSWPILSISCTSGLHYRHGTNENYTIGKTTFSKDDIALARVHAEVAFLIQFKRRTPKGSPS